jgi:hypothetical protein
MAGKLDDPDFSFGIYPGYFEPAFDSVTIHGIKTIVAAELLRYFFPPVSLMSECAWHYPYGLGLANKRATQSTDQQIRRVWSGLFVFCVLNP